MRSDVNAAIQRSFLGMLPTNIVDRVTAQGELVDYPAGATFYREGDPPQRDARRLRPDPRLHRIPGREAGDRPVCAERRGPGDPARRRGAGGRPARGAGGVFAIGPRGVHCLGERALWPGTAVPADTAAQRSRSDVVRYEVLRRFKTKCKEAKLGLSLASRKCLWTPKPENPINFWWWEPQSPADRVPLRDQRTW
jgi:hypothetical protein